MSIETNGELLAWIGAWLMPKYMPADFKKELEDLGLRIVPAKLPHGYFDATKEAMARAHRDMGDIWANVYAAAIAASPFAPENPNG